MFVDYPMRASALLCPFVPFLSRRGPQLGGAADLGDQNSEQGGPGRGVSGAVCSAAIGEDPGPLDGVGWGRALTADPK